MPSLPYDWWSGVKTRLLEIVEIRANLSLFRFSWPPDWRWNDTTSGTTWSWCWWRHVLIWHWCSRQGLWTESACTSRSKRRLDSWPIRCGLLWRCPWSWITPSISASITSVAQCLEKPSAKRCPKDETFDKWSDYPMKCRGLIIWLTCKLCFSLAWNDVPQFHSEVRRYNS